MMPDKTSTLVFEINKDLRRFSEDFLTIEEAQRICARLQKNAREFRHRRDRFNPQHTALRDRLERFGF